MTKRRNRIVNATVTLTAGVSVALFGATGSSSALTPPNVTCSQITQTFSGTAHDLTVPAEGYCDIENATITDNLIVQHDAGGDVGNSTIQHDAVYADGAAGDVRGSTIGHDLRYASDGGGAIFESKIGHDLTAGTNSELRMAATQIGHDVMADQPNTVQTGAISPTDKGHVQVGHDLIVTGSPGPPDTTAFVFDGMCDLTVGHDLSVTNRWVTLGIGLGDICIRNGEPPVTVGHDLVFSGNDALNGYFGPSTLEVGNVTVGNALIVTGNSATGYLEVADNVVAGNATCLNNSPAASLPESVDGPNHIGGTNNGCP